MSNAPPRITPWTPWPKEHHEETLEALHALHGGALPEWAIAADLVFLADRAAHPTRPRAFPGRRSLQERWGVSERVARRCLRHHGWQDTCHRLGIPLPERARPGVPVGVPPASPSPSPGPSPSGTDETPESGASVPATVPTTVPTTVPVDVHTRVERSHEPTSLRSHEEQEHTPLAPQGGKAVQGGNDSKSTVKTKARAQRKTKGRHEAFDEILTAWNEKVVPLTKAGPHPRLTHERGLGKDLNHRLHEHGRVDLLNLLVWYATGDDSRADFLRREGYALSTLLRPKNIDEYLSKSRAWMAAGCPKVRTKQTSAASTRGANPHDDDDDRAYLATWKPDPLPGPQAPDKTTLPPRRIERKPLAMPRQRTVYDRSSEAWERAGRREADRAATATDGREMVRSATDDDIPF